MKPRRGKKASWWNTLRTIIGPVVATHRTSILIAMSVVAAVPVLSYFAMLLHKKPLASESQELYFSLHLTAQRGLFEFLPARERLRTILSRELSSEADPAAVISAREIAVYMFPELLSGDDFEKKQAFELWRPLLQIIEDTDRVGEFSSQLEELRALLWQYENPDRQAPRLSSTAGQMIRIYESLAAAEASRP